MEPIKPGDLVVVLRGHCVDDHPATGIVRTVVALRSVTGKCAKCGQRTGNQMRAALSGDAPWAEWHIPLPYLKRIPPLEELEGQKSEEVRSLHANRTPTKVRA